jgi:hypothetical protein
MPHDWFSGWHRHASCRTGSPAQAKGAHACTQRCSCLHATFDKHPHLAYYVGIAALKNRSAKMSSYPLSRSPLVSIFFVPLIPLQWHYTHV